MKRIILSLLLTVIAVAGWGQEFTIDKINYVVTGDNTCSVLGAESDIAGDIVIPSNVTYDNKDYAVKKIDVGAFMSTNINSAVVSEGITTIGAYAFHACPNLQSVTLPSSLNELIWELVPDRTTSLYLLTSKFKNNSQIDDMEVANCLGFNICDEMTDDGLAILDHKVVGYIGNNEPGFSVNVPEGITAIGSIVFRGTNLTSITLPSTLETIGSSAFENCKSLTSIVIPEGTSSIRDFAFSGCSSLKDVTIKGQNVEIGYYVFEDCPNIKNITLYSMILPHSSNLGMLGEVYLNATLYVPDFCVDKYERTSPWQGFGHYVGIEIPGLHRTSADNINYILLDDSKTGWVTSVNPYYAGDIVIPNSIIYEDKTYYVKGIFEVAFAGSNCTSVVVSEGITTIGMFSFISCPKLTSVTLPRSLTEIVISGNRYINPTHAYIQRDKFINRSNIADDEAASKLCISFCGRRTDDGLVITNNIVEEYLNYGRNLSINIPDGVTGASFSVLSSGKVFSSITIPNSFTLGSPSDPRGISYALRSGFKNYTNYQDDEVAAYLGVLLVDEITADGFIIDGNAVVGYIGDSKTIVIPDGIEKINNSAFYQKDITTITLPRTLSVIDDYAFYNCDGISDITLLSETPPVMGGSVFISSIYNKVSLNVPYFSVNAYKVANRWKNFKNIVGFVPEGNFIHHLLNCKEEELTGDENAYLTLDDSEKRYVNGDGHEYDSNGLCKHCGQPKKCAKPTYDAENGLRCKTEGVQYDIQHYWIATSPEMPTDISLTIIAKKDGYIDSDPLLLSISKLDLNNDGKFDLNDLKYIQDKVLEK